MNASRTATTRSPRTGRRLAALAALPLVASLALVGCSSDDADDADRAGRPAAGSGADGSTASAGPSGSAAASNDALLAAVETATGAVGSGTVLSVEQEQNGTAWEVLVVDRDGVEHEVRTDAGGQEVDGSPRTETPDADDTAENERFTAAADLDVTDAVAAVEDLHAGTVTEIGLDDHLGDVVWEGDVRDGSGTKHSVRIDAGSGKVVTDTVDTDD